MVNSSPERSSQPSWKRVVRSPEAIGKKEGDRLQTGKREKQGEQADVVQEGGKRNSFEGELQIQEFKEKAEAEL